VTWGLHGCGGAKRRRWGGERRRFTGVMSEHVAGLGFECGLHWEIAGIASNQSRGSGGSGNDGRRWPAVRGVSGSTTRSHGRGKAWKRGKERPARILTTTEASGPLARWRGAAEWWCGEHPKLGNGRSGGARLLGFLGREAAAAAWEELGHRAGFIGRLQVPWCASPEPLAVRSSGAVPGRTQTWVRVWLEEKRGPTGGSARQRAEGETERGAGTPGKVGLGTCWAAWRRRKEGRGWAEQGEQGGGPGQLEWAARWERKKRRKPVGLGCK
jgi:hypothetical protein